MESQANEFKYNHKITNCLLFRSSKDVNSPFETISTAMHSGKIEIRHLFCYGELQGARYKIIVVFCPNRVNPN